MKPLDKKRARFTFSFRSLVPDSEGHAEYWAELTDPFPTPARKGNRIINVVVLYMSSRQSYGGAIGFYGPGGDIHAHLKIKGRSFDEFTTIE